MKILIYGGTFNPIHLAHINNLKLAQSKINFDKIIVVPNKIGHFKDESELISESDRIKMLEFGIELIKNFNVEISDVELKSNDRVFTNDLIDYFKKEYQDSVFYFLIGSDQALKLNEWYKIDELKSKVTFIVTKRDVNFNSEEFITINNQVMAYSSTAIRQKYESSGIDKVDEYIRQKGLYLDELINYHLSPLRAQHSKNVAMLAYEKAINFGIDSTKAHIAGMLHDITKEMLLKRQYEMANEDKEQFEINDVTVHQLCGVFYVRDVLKIKDEEILSAIKCHTTAYYRMNKLDKLIYVCDMLSKERDFKGVDQLREILNEDLDRCFKECFLSSYQYLIEKKICISEDLEKLKEMVERDEV